MNTGADVSYLLKAREALNESEKAEREGRANAAFVAAHGSIRFLELWRASILAKQVEKEAA